MLVLVITWVRMQLKIDLTNSNKKDFSECFGQRNLCSLLAKRSNSLLIAREVMALMVNHKIISFLIRPKSIPREQSCYERFEAIVVT